VQDNSWKNLVRSAYHRSRVVIAIVVVAIVFVRRAISDNRRRRRRLRRRHRRSDRIERQVIHYYPQQCRD